MDKVVHFEIPVDQIERARKFYAQVFEWEINSAPGMAYHMVNTTPVGEDYQPKEPGAINGGMVERGGGVQTPVLVVNVKEMKAAVERIKAAGGTLVKEPYQVGDMGIVGYFKDSEGNVLGVWQDLGRPSAS